MAHGCSGALREIGLDHYMQAEQTGWVLYLNGLGDLAVLQAFAGQLGHDVPIEVLRRPFVRYVSNSVSIFEGHFKALAAVGRGIRGCLLLDGPSADTIDDSGLNGVTTVRWRKWTITDYVLTRGALEAYAVRYGRSAAVGPLFASDQADPRLKGDARGERCGRINASAEARWIAARR